MKQRTTVTGRPVSDFVNLKPYPKGVSGNPAGRALLSKRAQQLVDEMSADFGPRGFDELTGVQKTMLRQACVLFARAERARNTEDAVKLVNAGCRVLGSLRNGRRKNHHEISLDEHLAQAVAEGNAP